MLGLLREGIRDKQCYELYARRGIFRIVLAFFSSPLCDQAAQVSLWEPATSGSSSVPAAKLSPGGYANPSPHVPGSHSAKRRCQEQSLLLAALHRSTLACT